MKQATWWFFDGFVWQVLPQEELAHVMEQQLEVPRGGVLVFRGADLDHPSLENRCLDVEDNSGIPASTNCIKDHQCGSLSKLDDLIDQKKPKLFLVDYLQLFF